MTVQERIERHTWRNFRPPPAGGAQDGTFDGLRMGRKDAIHLLCLSEGRNRELLAYAYDGQLNANGENHRVSFATGETDHAKAMIVGLQFVDAMKMAWERTYGAVATKERNAAPDGCIGQLLEDRRADFKAEYGEESSTFQGYDRELTIFSGLLGPRRRAWLPVRVEPELMAKLCKHRARSLDPETESVRQCYINLRFALRDLGFREDTYDAIRAPKRKGRGRSKKHSSEYPFYDSEIRVIWSKLSLASDGIQGLYHAMVCSTMQPVDGVMLTWKLVQEAREAILYNHRMKNYNPFRFWMSPIFWDWLVRRRKERPDDYYVFPEFVFTERERRLNPACTKAPATQKGAARLAEQHAQEEFGDFLRSTCELKRKGISLRSFRYYNSSALVGLGCEMRLVMLTTGHDTIESFLHYLTGLPEHLRKLGNVLLKHHQDVIAGRETEVFLTRAEMVEAIRKDTRENRLGLQSWLERRLDEMPEQFLRTLENLPRGCLRVEPDGCLVIRLPRHITVAPGMPVNGYAHDDTQLTLPLRESRN